MAADVPYFRRFGFALLAAGGLACVANVVSVLVRDGFFVLLAVLAPVALFTGVAMFVLPGSAGDGDLTNAGFERAWATTRPRVKLAWLAAFSIGLLAGFALMIALLPPPV